MPSYIKCDYHPYQKKNSDRFRQLLLIHTHLIHFKQESCRAICTMSNILSMCCMFCAKEGGNKLNCTNNSEVASSEEVVPFGLWRLQAWVSLQLHDDCQSEASNQLLIQHHACVVIEMRTSSRSGSSSFSAPNSLAHWSRWELTCQVTASSPPHLSTGKHVALI